MPAWLEVRNLTKHYREGERERPVLRDVDLDVPCGQILALVGRSGSGKSTLLNLLSGIDTGDAGEVVIAGTRLNALDEAARTRFRRTHIGFVFQFFNLIPTLTALENILLPLELARRLDDESKSHARDLLARVELQDRADSYPERLSGGEQQRVALIRALVHRPALLLADEPTGNLDSETGRAVMELLVRLARAQGQTAVLVTHSAEVAACADRVLTLRDGRIQDTP